jgi:hypothetical protein
LAFILVGRESADTKSVRGEGKMFAEFLDQANEVFSIQIDSGNEKFTVTRSGGDAWVVVEKSGYPAKFDMVKKTILDVAELELTAKKTDDPQRHTILGLDDPSPETGSALGLNFLDEQGHALASLLVGDKARSGQNRRYVRHPGNNQTWLGSGGPEVAINSLDWIDKNLLRVRHDRIRRIVFSHGDGDRAELERFDRKLFKYSVKNLPEGMKMASPGIVNATGGVLSFLKFLDVRPVSEVNAQAKPVTVTRLETWDGLVVTVSMYEFGGKTWSHLNVEFDEDLVAVLEDQSEADEGDEQMDASISVREEAAKAGPRNEKWAYLIDQDKLTKLRRRSEDFVVADVPESSENSPISDTGE